MAGWCEPGLERDGERRPPEIDVPASARDQVGAAAPCATPGQVPRGATVVLVGGLTRSIARVYGEPAVPDVDHHVGRIQPHLGETPREIRAPAGAAGPHMRG